MKLDDLPAAAQADWAEYLRQGGMFSLAVWWSRYKDDYRAETTS